MYFVAKVEMQTYYIKIHMKMTKLKCICIRIQMPWFFSCSALALDICHWILYVDFASQPLQQSSSTNT
jgi:hypothetical protein